jgi:aspartyl-tRNA synthetase
MDALENEDPLNIKAWQYDLVCNGFEIASGSIRNQSPEVMVKAFGIVGLEPGRSRSASAASTARSSTARRRMAAWRPASTASSCCIVGAKNLREVAVPDEPAGQDLLMGAPARPRRRRCANCAARAAAEGRLATSRIQTMKKPG